MKILDHKKMKRTGAYYDQSEDIAIAITKCLSMPGCTGVIDFDEIRRLGKVNADKWPDGYIHQTAVDLGLDVER